MAISEQERRQVVTLMGYLGMRRTSHAVHYLSVIVPAVSEKLPPGAELWTPAAEQFGQRTINVQRAVHMEIRRAYLRDPARFSELMPEGEVLFAPPRTREFIALAAKWLERHRFVGQAEDGRNTRLQIVERGPNDAPDGLLGERMIAGTKNNC